MKNNAKCPKCKQGYVMGWNGIVEGCDKCLGVVRDSQGNFWEPGEKHADYLDLSTGRTFRVSRRTALNPKPR
jgi:hypothetical protein